MSFHNDFGLIWGTVEWLHWWQCKFKPNMRFKNFLFLLPVFAMLNSQ
jgi:hypothetical protein